MKTILCFLLVFVCATALAASRTEYFHYYLDRGDPENARGYQAFIIEVDSLDRTLYSHVQIDNELKKRPKDKKLKALHVRAVNALSTCVRTHTGSAKRIRTTGGTDRPQSYSVFCDQLKGGCGNGYVTCDPTGRSLPSPCRATVLPFPN